MGGAVVVALGLAVAGRFVGEAREGIGSGDDGVASAAPSGVDAGLDEPVADDAGAPPDASYRADSRGRLVRAPDEPIVCRATTAEIPRSAACDRGRAYPACRWQLPVPEEGQPWEIWRNTTDDHRWGRPALVSVILATAEEYARRWPGEHMVVGDLDAPGPRHQTHDRGHDVDLYLLDAMIARNEGGGRYPDNYEDRRPSEVRALRARVLDLAKIIATCASGRIRIYYNDPDIIRPFRAWFDEQGMASDVGPPMRMHNDLHRFHFHLTISDELEPL